MSDRENEVRQAVRKTVGVVLFDDVEVLDFTGPYEVLAGARLDESARWQTDSPFDLRLVAQGDVVRCYGGMRVNTDHRLDDCPPLDWLIVPGGWGTRRETDNAALVGWIGERSRQAALTASVCTGARLLAAAGVLDGRRATTHWNSLDWLAESYPQVRVERDLHVVDDGDVVTSAGISAGIDLAMTLVARECGEAVATQLARYMEYPYPQDNRRRVATDG